MLNHTFIVVLRLVTCKDSQGNWVKPKKRLTVEKKVDCPAKAFARIFALNEVENKMEQWEVVSVRKV
jgi:hypothetical protein